MLKSFLHSLLFLLQLSFTSEAQDHNYVKNPAIGIHFIMDDFKAADYIRSNSLFAVFRDKQFVNSKNLKPGLAISYLQGIARHVDFSVTLAGSYLDYTLHNGQSLGSGKLLLETDILFVRKIFSDKNLISPYIASGVGASSYNNYYGVFIPVGTGLQVNFFNEAYVLLNTQYRIAITNKTNNHFYYSLGVAGNIKKIKIKKPVINPAMRGALQSYDRDKDGIPDSADICPDVPGLQQFHGCPDSDGDGIADYEDMCPTVPGIIKYLGCPIPDTDGDGINDESDSCVMIPGVIRYHGCPIPDSDSDGINDEEDKCPLETGSIENQGCPVLSETIKKEIALDAQQIFFRTGSHDLLPESFQALNDVANVLKLNPLLQLLIEGNTDNVGTLIKNQLLSQSRAQAVLDYLVLKNGINKNRLSLKGYGFSKPATNNKTSKGRSLNRRVELRLFY